MEEGEKKRKFVRFTISVIVEFKPTSESTNYSWGMIKSFSYGGFSFESNFDFEPREDFEVKLKFPRGAVFSILGDIVWKRKDENIYSAGIKFREKDKKVKDEILKEISSYVNVPLDRIMSPLI